jgi:benzylsuccinate CoA-transferase BbsF subunit
VERHDREADLECRVGEWSKGWDARALATHLQAAGIDAFPVLDFGDVHDDPQLKARGHYITIEHPTLGARDVDRSSIRLRGVGPQFARPAPMLGQHSGEIVTEILGLSEGALSMLLEAKVLH